MNTPRAVGLPGGREGLRLRYGFSFFITGTRGLSTPAGTIKNLDFSMLTWYGHRFLNFKPSRVGVAT
eukprot:5736968-Pyramimonas_sp.AAC.1